MCRTNLANEPLTNRRYYETLNHYYSVITFTASAAVSCYTAVHDGEIPNARMDIDGRRRFFVGCLWPGCQAH